MPRGHRTAPRTLSAQRTPIGPLAALAAGEEGAGPRAGAALERLLRGPDPHRALGALRDSAELAAVLPAIAAMAGFDQRSPHHPEGDLFVHTQQVLQRIGALSDDPDLRWAAVYHDTGKPESMWLDEGGVGHFYAHPDHANEAHEVISARICERDLRRLGLPARRRRRIVALVAHHMRAQFSSVRGARRFIDAVGEDLVEPLLVLREADHEGKGDPAAHITRMRELCARARATQGAPARPRVAIGGEGLMRHLGVGPGPVIGRILGALHAEVAAGHLPDEPAALRARARALHAGGAMHKPGG